MYWQVLGHVPSNIMKIHVITPASLRSRKGNGVTALRWVRILKKLGHQVIDRQTLLQKDDSFAFLSDK